MEIPTALIHRLQSSLRETAAAATGTAAPPPPFLSVTDAVAAFDSSSSSSPELRCGRCGAAGGLLRGKRSAVCAYCGSVWRGKGGGGDAGVAFRGTAAYAWLLESLGLDGSEPVDFDTEPTVSSKSKEAPKSGMTLSDLLDLKLTCPPENKETSGSAKSKDQLSATYALNLSGVDLDSFFTERKENIPPAAALPRTHAIVQEKQSTDNRSHGSASSETFVSHEGFQSSGMKASSPSTNQTEPAPAFAKWDDDFQSAGSEYVVTDSKQVDLFQSSSAAESFGFPGVGTGSNLVVGTENETKTKSTVLEHSEDLPSESGKLVEDNRFNQNVAQPISESSTRIIPQNSVDEFSKSSLSNLAQSDQWCGRGDTGGSIDEAFDDWQEFTGENQGSLSNSGDQMEGALASDPFGIKTVDPWPINSKEPSNNVDDSFDDWQAFASSSGQGGEGLVKPVVEAASTSIEHSLEPKSVDLWPIDNVREYNRTEIVKETSDSFDDWQDFTSSSQAQGTSSSPAGDMTGVSHVSHTEIESMDSWFTGNIKDSRNLDLVNGNNVSLDDWQGFTGSDQAQLSSHIIGGAMMDLSFEQHKGTESVHSWVNSKYKESRNTESTNTENNSFDIWQDFTTSNHPQENLANLGGEMMSVSSKPAKETNSMDLWLTSNMKESNSTSRVNGIDDSSNGWQGTSFGQTQGNLQIPGEGPPSCSIKDSSETEHLDLWAASHVKQFGNLEQINENNDPFEEWQDFTSSGPPEGTLPSVSNASLLVNRSASKPDSLLVVEFGSFAQSASSQKQADRKESSNEANTVPYDASLGRMNGLQQMSEVDPLSTIWPTTSPDSNFISKQEPTNANVDKLLSQMHDLSFMLKDELSVPDKPVDHRSKP